MASYNNVPTGANFGGQNGMPMQSVPNQQVIGQPTAPTFNPQQNPMLWTIPQQNQQPQGPRTIVDWVDGEAGMNAYPLGPDTIAYLMDKTDTRFFIKITDKSGMLLSSRRFRFTEEVDEIKPEEQPITREEFDNLFKMVSEIKEAL